MCIINPSLCSVGERTQVLCAAGKLYALSNTSSSQLGALKRPEYKCTEGETQLSQILLQLSCSLGALLRQIFPSRLELHYRLVRATGSQARSLPATRATLSLVSRHWEKRLRCSSEVNSLLWDRATEAQSFLLVLLDPTSKVMTSRSASKDVL